MQLVVNNNILNYDFYENNTSNKHLLILPGWKRTSAEWSSTARILNNTYNVIVLDFPGFGISPKPVADFDTYDYAQITHDFLEKLKIHKCTILGHSFGGRVATILAATTDNVDKLVLVDSAGLNHNSRRARITHRLLEATRSLYTILPKKVSFELRRLVGSTDYNNAGELRTSFVKIVNQNLLYLLKDIKAETLIIWGDKDAQLSVQETKIFKREIPNSRVRIVWGSGHNPHTEKSDKFLEILREFIC